MTQPLLEPYLLADLLLPYRVVMAPWTRARAYNPVHVPMRLMREYYTQRATAGLIISEGTWISENSIGGSIENRARFLFEALEAVLEVWPSQRVGIRTGPITNEVDPTGTHVESLAGDRVIHRLRKHYSRTFILNAGIDREHANQLLKDDRRSLVAFGRLFIASPDLVERICLKAPLNELRPEGFYGPSPVGYTDYPSLTPRPNRGSHKGNERGGACLTLHGSARLSFTGSVIRLKRC